MQLTKITNEGDIDCQIAVASRAGSGSNLSTYRDLISRIYLSPTAANQYLIGGLMPNQELCLCGDYKIPRVSGLVENLRQRW